MAHRLVSKNNQLTMSSKQWQKLVDVWSTFLSPKTPCSQLKNAFNQTRRWEVAIEICGDYRIRKLNNTFRKKNKVTDVLSFPQFNDLRKLKKDFFPSNVVTSLGDIVICLPQARRQAKAHQISNDLELAYLANHGILHLIGFDHEISNKEENIMQQWEDHLIEKLQLKYK